MESSFLEIQMALGTNLQKLPRILPELVQGYAQLATIWTVCKPKMSSLIGLDGDDCFARPAKIGNCLHEVALDVILLNGLDRFAF